MTTLQHGPAEAVALDPAFAQMAVATARQAWALPQLSDREKVFLAITADVCQPALGLPFALHVREGRARGVSTEDVRALIRFVSYDSGYPAALAALERLAEIEASTSDGGGDDPIDTAAAAALLPPELVSTGPDAAPSPLPEPVRERLAALDPGFLDYFDLQSRMRAPHGPGTLSERERAFATMSVDVHYRTLGDTFAIHTGRALRAGATHEDVRAVLRFNAQFGSTRAWEAWHALNAILREA